MKKIYISIILILMINLSASAESNFSYTQSTPQNLYQSSKNSNTYNSTKYPSVSPTQKDNGEKYSYRTSIISPFCSSNSTEKTLTNAHNNLAKRNNELEDKVEKLNKKVKELEYKINMLELNRKS